MKRCVLNVYGCECAFFRLELCAEVGVKDDEKSSSLPLLSNIVAAYTERIRRKINKTKSRREVPSHTSVGWASNATNKYFGIYWFSFHITVLLNIIINVGVCIFYVWIFFVSITPKQVNGLRLNLVKLTYRLLLIPENMFLHRIADETAGRDSISTIRKYIPLCISTN